MTILVTGAAGFIGYHVATALLGRGEAVIGLDNLSDYYDVRLKEARLERLGAHAGFTFARADIADGKAIAAALEGHGDIDRVVHLAAQAGVRHSIDHPFDYARANLVGHLTVLEVCRGLPGLRHLVYASSSSVYGGNTTFPFSTADRVDSPISLYAATKKSAELMSHCYAHLYGIPQTGLRFFTAYGPWGRPDMALFIFAKAIVAGSPIHLFNNGDMKRDFTYIDDVVAGTLAALDRPPTGGEAAPNRVYNIGNNRTEPLLRLVELLENALGAKAERILDPMPPGDVKETYADISEARSELGYAPSVTIDEGVPRFAAWFRDHYGV
jgi:UDP-glucuronate 4-epimerase